MKKLRDYHIIDRAREKVRAAEVSLSALRLERRKAERELARLLVRLGYAVQGDPAHGGDSPFHTALGYVPASKRHPGRPAKNACRDRRVCESVCSDPIPSAR